MGILASTTDYERVYASPLEEYNDTPVEKNDYYICNDSGKDTTLSYDIQSSPYCWISTNYSLANGGAMYLRKIRNLSIISNDGRGFIHNLSLESLENVIWQNDSHFVMESDHDFEVAGVLDTRDDGCILCFTARPKKEKDSRTKETQS
jgi:hypothetical protein